MNIEKKYKSLIKDCIVIFIISILFLVISEIILRAVFPKKVVGSQPITSLAYEFNEDYLLSIKPNIKKPFTRHYKNGAYTVNGKPTQTHFEEHLYKKTLTTELLFMGTLIYKHAFQEKAEHS